MRRNYIDNLRTFAIFLLFFYHTAMMFNSFESFYVYSHSVKVLNAFLIVAWPWFMPLLFVLAGVSSAYALNKRTAGQYINERVRKLLVPLLSGVLLLVPMQTYFAERFHNGYTGGYLAQYVLFFTKPTDLTGYHGGFTPAQLWFVLYLFVISLLALPLMLWYNKRETKIDANKLTLPLLLPVFLIPLLMALILNIGGKSVGEYFAYFMLGFLVLSRDEVIERLRRNRWILLGLSVLLLGTLCYLSLTVGFSLATDILMRAAGWVSVLALMGGAKQWFDYTGKTLTYLAGASFVVYVFHQSWLVAAGYYALRVTHNAAAVCAMVIPASILLSIASYEVVKRIPVTRWMFGLGGFHKGSKQKEIKGEITL